MCPSYTQTNIDNAAGKYNNLYPRDSIEMEECRIFSSLYDFCFATATFSGVYLKYFIARKEH